MDGKKYVEAHDIQKRDASDVIDEFTDELASMNGTCLDIGCGPGNITNDLILPKLSKNSVITGIDISNVMIQQAHEIHKNNKRLSFLQLDIETNCLPINEIEKYDCAVSFYCLHWCQDIRRALDNIYKLLRPGAHALIMFLSYNSGFDAYKIMQHNPRFKPYMEDTMKYIPVFQYCPNPRLTMKKALEEAGFQVLHCSNREKTFIFKNMEILQNHIIAVNPFLHRMPDDLKDEYINEITKEIAVNKILFESKNDTKQGYSVLDRYRLLITYFRKPADSLMIVR